MTWPTDNEGKLLITEAYLNHRAKTMLDSPSGVREIEITVRRIQEMSEEEARPYLRKVIEFLLSMQVKEFLGGADEVKLTYLVSGEAVA